MPSISRDSLLAWLAKHPEPSLARQMAELRLEYSEIAMLRNTFMAALRAHERIYPTILPTQASGRWSYIDPPLSNFPKRCINPLCPAYHHERTTQCWDSRDCIMPDKGTFWVEHDLDAVEHRIYCLVLDWKERLNDLRAGVDIHTPVTCNLFGLPLCSNAQNPHTAPEDAAWRQEVNWQGKDDTRRTMSKNFTYGGQYFYVKEVHASYRTRRPYRVYHGLLYNPHFVYSIPHIQSYKVINEHGVATPPDFEALAVRFFESNAAIQHRKALAMERYRKEKESRTLFGNRRRAYFSNESTAKELFNHVIQGTVAGYINESCILLQAAFPDSYLVHNKHDSLKWAFPYQSTSEAGRSAEEQQVLQQCKEICQRELTYRGNSIPISATFHVIKGEM